MARGVSHDLRQDARRIFDAAVRGADPAVAVRAAAAALPAWAPGRTFAAGAGKAAAVMARALEETLGEGLGAGVVVIPRGHMGGDDRLRRVRVLEAGHPLPDRGSVEAGRALLAFLEARGPDDRVIGLVSGGASALLATPVEGHSLEALRAASAEGLRSGRPIEEINATRGALSRTADGGLSRAGAPGQRIAWVISDVVGDRLDVIGSAPFAPSDCRILLTNADALEAARRSAEELGYRVEVVTRRMVGEARRVGARIGAALRDGRGASPRCLLYGGETTVTVTGPGLGGRNQELALAAAEPLRGLRAVALLAAGSDGRDGPTDAAGAVVDGATAGRCDVTAALATNDSHPACEAAGALVRTGPTGTQVMDIVVGLTRPLGG